MSERTITKEVTGGFRADGFRIFKDGDEKHWSDGSRTLGMSFPVCDVWEHVTDREKVASWIAEALNAYQNSESKP